MKLLIVSRATPLALAISCAAMLLSTGCQELNAQGTTTSPASTEPVAQQTTGPSIATEHQYPEPDPGNLRAFVELARKDIQLRKATIIAENMTFTEEEAAAFWPIHREYEAELARLSDRKLDLIRKFLPQAARMTEDNARALAKESFEIEGQRTALKRDYFAKFQEAIPATKAARFLQLENQLNMVLELRLAAALPLIK